MARDALKQTLARWLPAAPEEHSVTLQPALKPLDVKAFVLLAKELVPLLEQHKFDAISRLAALRSLAAGSAAAAALNAVDAELQRFHFEAALELLCALLATTGDTP